MGKLAVELLGRLRDKALPERITAATGVPLSQCLGLAVVCELLLEEPEILVDKIPEKLNRSSGWVRTRLELLCRHGIVKYAKHARRQYCIVPGNMYNALVLKISPILQKQVDGGPLLDQIPGLLRRDVSLPAAVLYCLLSLGAGDYEGSVSVDLEVYARWFSCSSRQVSRYLAELVRAGVLSDRGCASPYYKLVTASRPDTESLSQLASSRRI